MSSNKKIALITGANKGIGYETAKRLGKQGYMVVIAARDESRGKAAAQVLSAEGIEAVWTRLDVTKPDSIKAAAAFVAKTYGVLDVLVNNAGIVVKPDHVAPSEVDVSTLRQTYETNVFGVVAVTNAFLPLLRKSSAGRIVNVSTTMGSLAAWSNPESPQRKFAPLLLAYDTSKTALNGVTVHYAVELKETTIKVNAASPAYVATDLNGHKGHVKLEEVSSIAAVVRLATLPDDGPTGTFEDNNGPIAW